MTSDESKKYPPQFVLSLPEGVEPPPETVITGAIEAVRDLMQQLREQAEAAGQYMTADEFMLSVGASAFLIGGLIAEEIRRHWVDRPVLRGFHGGPRPSMWRRYQHAADMIGKILEIVEEGRAQAQSEKSEATGVASDGK